MTIDERLDRLTDRHEALAQSLELTWQQVNQTSRTVEILSQSVLSLVEMVRNHEKRIQGLEAA